jgi:DNA invertase Pin-like site-specific DNA recombinase
LTVERPYGAWWPSLRVRPGHVSDAEGEFTEFERSMIRERVMAGLSPAKAESTQLGRRRLEDTDAGKVAAFVTARAAGSRD